MIGYASVAAFYGVFDILAGRGALYTVDLLGKAVFRGLRDPAVLGVPMSIDTTAVILYNALHLFLSLIIGIIVTALVEYSERHPSRSPLVAMVIIGGFAVTIIGVGMMTSSFRSLLPWSSIIMANIIAVFVAGLYLIWKRPAVWGRLSPFAG